MSKRSPYVEIKTFWGTMSNNGPCRVKARPVVVPGYERFVFYAYRSIRGTSRRGDETVGTATDQWSSLWTVVEGTTKLAVAVKVRGMAEAIDHAKEKLDQRGGVSELNKMLARHLITHREKR